MYRLPPKSYIESNSFVLEVGEELDLSSLRIKLENYGYSFVTKVMTHGEFALRGSIIDIFPMGATSPYRIDLLGTQVDAIRIFDEDTQRSVGVVKNIQILPARELPFDDLSIDRFRTSWRKRLSGNPLNAPIYQAISAKNSYPGMEYYLPLFFLVPPLYLII